VANGAYQEAIDILQTAYREQPRDPLLASAYIDSLETMAATADRAFQRQDFGSAGKTYAVLQKNRGHFKGIDRELSFSFAGLNDKLATCKKALLTGGFEAYRSGHLDQAIALWQDLLVIDPQNTPIQDALHTAKRQQKNLQEVGSGL
jgi:tetratricopeptide (TPR) repeat protein